VHQYYPAGRGGGPRIRAKRVAECECCGTFVLRGKIVGLGAIKRFRPRYATGIACKCGAAIPTATLELGYVAIDPAYRGHKFSHRIVEALLSGNESRLFATTSTPQMKTVLMKAGFKKNGNEWQGRSAQLSCWVWERQSAI
jgi:GNAT superfamily N-acetyltransferase